MQLVGLIKQKSSNSSAVSFWEDYSPSPAIRTHPNRERAPRISKKLRLRPKLRGTISYASKRITSYTNVTYSGYSCHSAFLDASLDLWSITTYIATPTSFPFPPINVQFDGKRSLHTVCWHTLHTEISLVFATTPDVSLIIIIDDLQEFANRCYQERFLPFRQPHQSNSFQIRRITSNNMQSPATYSTYNQRQATHQLTITNSLRIWLNRNRLIHTCMHMHSAHSMHSFAFTRATSTLNALARNIRRIYLNTHGSDAAQNVKF